MWNLVAADTREAQVYLRLLDKIEQQRVAYHGQVFDVLGEAMSGAELRRLLIDAIRYGDDPDVRDRINRVIDDTIGDRVRDAIEHPPLAAETMGFADIDRIRTEMQEAAARRLQPHYIRAFVEAALAHLGGKLIEREPGRFSLPSVPAAVRQRDRQIGTGAPVLTRYERVTFDKDNVRQPGAPPAELLAPGHPLLAATIDLVLERHRGVFRQGTVLVDEGDDGDEPRVLVMLEHAIADGRRTRAEPHTVVSRRFEFVEIPRVGEPRTTGYAPYLDYRAPMADELDRLKPVLDSGWLDTDLEAIGREHAIEVAVPEHLAKVRLHTEVRVDATMAAVKERLTREITYWDQRANDLQLKADAGKTPQMNADRARQRADRIAQRLDLRLAELGAERSLRALPPVVVGGALVIPGGLVRRRAGEQAPVAEEFAISRREVEARAVAAVLATEEALGWTPQDMNTVQRNHPGYDVRSTPPRTSGEPADVRFIEVKGRIAGAPTVTVSRNEILTSLNEPERFVLALVEVSSDHGETVRYLRRPFPGRSEEMLFDVTSINFDWAALWSRAEQPL
jgi:hypothetical protein